MKILTDRDIYYNAPGDEKKTLKERLDALRQNQLFQTGAAAYGGYLQQKYQGGGFQPLPVDANTSVNNNLPIVPVEVKDIEPGMSKGVKIAIVSTAVLIVGIVVFIVVKKMKNKK